MSESLEGEREREREFCIAFVTRWVFVDFKGDDGASKWYLLSLDFSFSFRLQSIFFSLTKKTKRVK